MRTSSLMSTIETRPHYRPYNLLSILQETLVWISREKQFRVEETACNATGEPFNSRAMNNL